MPDFMGKTVLRIKPFELGVTTDQTDWTRKSRPVFLISFTDGSKLVLKAEGASTHGPGSSLKSIDIMGELHSKLTRDLGVVILQPEDLQPLMEAPDECFDFAPPAVARKYIVDLVAAGGGKMFVWYTMNFVEGFKKLEDQVEKNKDHQSMEKVGAYKLARKMCQDPRLLPNLGKVVAVDLFCGNRDRFGDDGRLVNLGNIGFQKDLDKTYAPVGGDFFESQGTFSNMYVFSVDKSTWGGMVLGDPDRILAFANTAIQSLNTLFASKIAPRGMPNDGVLGMAQVDALVAGITEGAALLKYQLNRKLRSTGVPSGVKARMEALGWINPQLLPGQGVTRGNTRLGQFRNNPLPPPVQVQNPPVQVQQPILQLTIPHNWMSVKPNKNQ